MSKDNSLLKSKNQNLSEENIKIEKEILEIKKEKDDEINSLLQHIDNKSYKCRGTNTRSHNPEYGNKYKTFKQYDPKADHTNNIFNCYAKESKADLFTKNIPFLTKGEKYDPIATQNSNKTFNFKANDSIATQNPEKSCHFKANDSIATQNPEKSYHFKANDSIASQNSDKTFHFKENDSIASQNSDKWYTYSDNLCISFGDRDKNYSSVQFNITNLFKKANVEEEIYRNIIIPKSKKVKGMYRNIAYVNCSSHEKTKTLFTKLSEVEINGLRVYYSKPSSLF